MSARAGFLAVSLWAAPLGAQGVDPAATVDLTIRTFDAVAIVAPPPWVNAADELPDSQVFRNQGDSGNGTQLFIQEFIPPGQDFDDWVELYAVSAETPLDAPADNYLQGQINAFGRACASVDAARVADNVILLACSQYDDRPDLGEIGLFNFQKLGATLVKNYYEVRVPAFDPDEWEDVAEGVPGLATAIDRLDRFRLAPAPEN